jgi:hypothetical protein
VTDRGEIFVSDADDLKIQGRITEIAARDWEAAERPALLTELDGSLAVVLRGLLTGDDCARWVRAVMEARGEWVEDFGGEQFALGRAFYTHVESGRAAEYFADTKGSDARVERVLPGMQQRMRELYGRIVGGVAQQRRGFCGAAVHVFPAGEKVAREGGVVHFDVEGLTQHHVERRARAVTLVAMLQPPRAGGGLRVWSPVFPVDDPGDEEPSVVRYGVGDVVVMDSYRLHQIEAFDGELDRVSITLHGVHLDRARWESWF